MYTEKTLKRLDDLAIWTCIQYFDLIKNRNKFCTEHIVVTILFEWAEWRNEFAKAMILVTDWASLKSSV